MKNWNGIGVSDGLASGRVVRMHKIQTKKLTSLEQIRACCMEKTVELYESTKEKMGEEAAQIFSAYEMLMHDTGLYRGVNERLDQGMDLEQAIEEGFEEKARVFDCLPNEYIRQRAEDIRGLKKMHLDMINGERSACEDLGDRKYILVAEEVTPLDFAIIDVEHLGGLVVKNGGRFSHAMIMARSMNIPAVTGLKEVGEIENGDEVFLDGTTGEVVVIGLRERGREELQDSQIVMTWKKKFHDRVRQMEYAQNLPKGRNLTADGTEIQLRVNINGPEDLKNLDMSALKGVGLYRTEYLFFDRNELPTIEEQQKEYEKVFDLLNGKDIIFRTLDAGGDKRVPYLEPEREENPFLGIRGIRFSLKHLQVMEDQIEAILRASKGRPFSLMFPMINIPEEMDHARAAWKRVYDRLLNEGCKIYPAIRLGIMIETPAAAICIDTFMDRVDFVSLGSNDLSQYLMAADREKAELDYLLSPWQPAVMRVMQHVIRVCNEHGKEVSICGEAGGEPEYMKYLIRSGLRNISVSKARVDIARLTISETVIE